MSVASGPLTRASNVPVTYLVTVAGGVFPRSTPCEWALRGFLPRRVFPDKTTRRHGLARLPPDWVGAVCLLARPAAQQQRERGDTLPRTSAEGVLPCIRVLQPTTPVTGALFHAM